MWSANPSSILYLYLHLYLLFYLLPSSWWCVSLFLMALLISNIGIYIQKNYVMSKNPSVPRDETQ